MAAKMPQEALYSCEVCGLEGLADEDLRSHMMLVHLPGTTACPFCDLEDITAPEMVYHVNSAHLDYLSPQDEDLDDDDLLLVTNGYGELPEGSVQDRDDLDNRRVPLITVDDDGDGDGYNANLSPSHGKGGGSRGSPSRAQLSLNLNQQRKRDAPITPSPGVPSCPICGLQESSPRRLEEHVNRAHFDLTSPSFPAVTIRQEVVLTCPLCMKQFESTPDLELHVNIQHKDILSPAKVGC